jgi:hypothetical protein
MKKLLVNSYTWASSLRQALDNPLANGGMGSLYRSAHELVLVFRARGEKHLNNVQLGRFGRNRTNVWNYPGMNSFARRGRARALDLHPTVKPIAMVADAIRTSPTAATSSSIPSAAAARRSLRRNVRADGVTGSSWTRFTSI